MTHALESSDPDWQRGHMGARIAIRDSPDPDSLRLLQRHATTRLELAEQTLADAERRLNYARGFAARMTEHRQETAG